MNSVVLRLVRGLVATMLGAAVAYLLAYVQNSSELNPYIVMVSIPLLNTLGKMLREAGLETPF